MNVFLEYVKGDIKNNAKTYKITKFTIFIAVIIISLMFFGIGAYCKSYKDLIGDITGGFHFRIISQIPSEKAEILGQNRYIKNIGFYSENKIENPLIFGKKINLITSDDIALTTVKSLLKFGSLPKENQVLISNDLSQKLNKTINDKIKLGNKYYKISGIYYDKNYQYSDFFDVYLNLNQREILKSQKNVSCYIWYKNIFRTYDISRKILKDIKDYNPSFSYNDMYLDRAFVFDFKRENLNNYSLQITVIVIFLISAMLFYFLISNLLLVQESKSIKDYARLKSIGATKKDINRIISLKILNISQIPVISGILFSFFCIKLLFYILNKVEIYFEDVNNIFSSEIFRPGNVDIKLGILIYLISLLIIYIGAKKPEKFLNKNTILQGMNGKIKSKNYLKTDLKYTGNIENDLSKQFYKNSIRYFKSASLTLKIGFVLMVFVMAVITQYTLDKKYNRQDEFEFYNIYATYGTIDSLNEKMINSISNLDIDQIVDFRKETTYMDLDKNLVSSEYLDKGYYKNLEKEIGQIKDLRVDIFGIEDKIFDKLAYENNLNPNDYNDNKVIVLNLIGEDFKKPVSKIKLGKFLKDSVEKMNLSEYGNVLDTRGYEFELDVKTKIYKPFFNYPIKKNRLNVYMKKSQYENLFSKFEKIASIDNSEMLAIRSKNLKSDLQKVNLISLEYFNEDDFQITSKIQEESMDLKRNIIGNIVISFILVFFVIMGVSSCYFAIYILFLKRRKSFILYKSLGMDRKLLSSILLKEKNKIVLNFTGTMILWIFAICLFVSQLSKNFNFFDLLMNLNYYFIILYIILIYITITCMYNKYRKDIII